MKKAIEVTIDIDIARKMLGVAGFPETHKMNEDEVFSAVLSLIECYGASYETKN